MPKHALTLHDDENPSGKKSKVERGPKQNHLPTDGEMENMSVREKLLAGVSFSFVRRQQVLQQQKPAHNQPSYAPVASLQEIVDEAFRVKPSIRQSLDDAPESGMMLPGEIEERFYEESLVQRRKILTDHYHQRMTQRRDASRRLQAVLRQANDNPFAPPVETSSEQGPEDNLRLFLQSACRTYGYRKLQMDFCGFMRIKVQDDLKGEPLGSVPREPTVEPADSVNLDASEGNITLYECDVPDQFDRVTTWMWLKICRLLTAYELGHHPAPDMPKEEEEREDEAWVIIAIPKSQIETLEYDWSFCPARENETHGDYIMDLTVPHSVREDSQNYDKRKGLAFRYSRDGVPSIASSKKSSDGDSMWFGFRTDVDEMQWERIQEDMETNKCLVHALSKMDAEWVHVAPEQYRKIEEPQKRTEAEVPHKTKSSSGVRRFSNLRNEVHSGDC
ncbi:hypothetical protein A0O28_0046540 [Trichoderma guizhouense]|uniref:Uncharacterized protein n=1 Tax=Trichoderma guizhouense TaxID=1491466 RepID=A0A1T3CD14_9HYPO|nr:hypothetical protein A0O28_0046540 [Trichoderma guizhouense]